MRKEKDDYYAKSSAIPGAWKIDSSSASPLAADLDRSLDDFRNKQLFDFGYADPEKIEYHSGTTSIVLSRTGNDWMSNGKKMDTNSAEGLVTAVRDLAASKFVTSGFSSPSIDLTVTSDNGKRVEKVQIQKAERRRDREARRRAIALLPRFGNGERLDRRDCGPQASGSGKEEVANTAARPSRRKSET